MTELQHRDRFFVKQRLTMMVNRYEIRETKADGSEGAIIAMVLPGLRVRRSCRVNASSRYGTGTP